MASTAEIKTIELRRLAELEKQRAYSGIDTEPAILIEIAELRAKYGADAVAVSATQGGDDKRIWQELDFLRAMLTSVMREVAADKEAREPRQRNMTLWMVMLSVAVLADLYFLAIIAHSVFR